jgi:hypothetical protein
MNENIQRKDLNPIEEARGYKMLKDEFHLTHERLAEMFGKSRPYITNSLRLLDLDLFLNACVESGAITPWQARIIFGLPPEVIKYRLATLALNWRLTTRELERIVAEIKGGALAVIFDREVLVEGLWFDLVNCPPNWNEPPLSPNVPSVRINATGAVIRGCKAAQDAMFSGVERLLCRIDFSVEYLKERYEIVQISSSERALKTTPGILPPMGEKQLKKMSARAPSTPLSTLPTPARAAYHRIPSSQLSTSLCLFARCSCRTKCTVHAIDIESTRAALPRHRRQLHRLLSRNAMLRCQAPRRAAHRGKCLIDLS